jgi:hypothetical protein
MSDELNDVKNKIDEYDQKLRNAEEKGNQELILTYEKRLVALSQKENILLSKTLGMCK